MFRNYFLINILLFIIVAFIGFEFYKALTYPMDIPSKPGISEVETDTTAVTGEDNSLKETSFRIITEKDIFRPSRTAASLLKNDSSKQIFPQNLPKLFGTIIINNNKTALLEDTATKVTKSYHLNDSVAGFVVSDIQKNKVILSKNNKTFEVQLRDRKGFKSSGRSPYSPRSRRVQKRKPERPPSPSPPPSRRKTRPPDAIEDEEY